MKFFVDFFAILWVISPSLAVYYYCYYSFFSGNICFLRSEFYQFDFFFGYFMRVCGFLLKFHLSKRTHCDNNDDDDNIVFELISKNSFFPRIFFMCFVFLLSFAIAHRTRTHTQIKWRHFTLV